MGFVVGGDGGEVEGFMGEFSLWCFLPLQPSVMSHFFSCLILLPS